MPHTPVKRYTRGPAFAVLVRGEVLFPASTVAAISTNTVTYKGPMLDRLRVIVQVTIVVHNKQIMSVRPRVFVRTPRSRLINEQALPVLNREVMAAQSANIQMVSGVTDTSHGYITSLQSAVNEASKQ